VKSFAASRYWRCYESLPERIRRLADKNYALFCDDPWHPSLWFKPLVGDVWSVRVGRDYRALCRRDGEVLRWFWIGTHQEYDQIVRQLS
jgi:hypothetical protein